MVKLSDYKFHELCLLFPLLPDNELEELAKDIKKNSLLNPIALYDGKILDGRNRFLACLKAKVEPTFRIISSEVEAIAIVISMNLKRRHLKSAEKVEIGLQLHKTLKKKDKKEKKIDDPNLKILMEMAENKRIAKSIGSKANTVKQVRMIIKKAEKDPEIKKHFEKAKRGRVSIDTVYKKAMDKGKSKEKPIIKIKVPKEKENIELRQELIDVKEEMKLVKIEKIHIRALYSNLVEIARELGFWEQIKERLAIFAEKKKGDFPTVKQLREAGLL